MIATPCGLEPAGMLPGEMLRVVSITDTVPASELVHQKEQPPVPSGHPRQRRWPHNNGASLKASSTSSSNDR